MHSSENSIATFLAIEWIGSISPAFMALAVDGQRVGQVEKLGKYLSVTPPAELLHSFGTVINRIVRDNGTWQLKWGDINRFQRVSSAITPVFNDSLPSYPVAFAASTWGMLPSYVSKYLGTKKRYGENGNSFICVVEFGSRIQAKSLLAGGQSGDPASRHFFDQGEMYSKGIFKEVLFYKEEVLKHIEREYHPGK